MNRCQFFTIQFLFLLFCLPGLTAQIAKKGAPKYVTATYYMWDLDGKDLDINQWKMLEQEYFDKVTNRNEFIRSSTYYLHRFSENSAKILHVQTFESWEDIDKSTYRNGELEAEAWPNSDERKAFLKKMSAFYKLKHTDEIYRTLPRIKPLTEFATKDQEMLLFLRINHFSKYGNGVDTEFEAIQKLLLERIYNKNEFIKGYYTNVHAWGSDKTEYLEAYYVRSMADLEKMFAKNDELMATAWTTESEKERVNKGYSSYFTGVHGDYIYVAVPEFSK